jgi:hypothetical protein
VCTYLDKTKTTATGSIYLPVLTCIFPILYYFFIFSECLISEMQ